MNRRVKLRELHPQRFGSVSASPVRVSQRSKHYSVSDSFHKFPELSGMLSIEWSRRFDTLAALHRKRGNAVHPIAIRDAAG